MLVARLIEILKHVQSLNKDARVYCLDQKGQSLGITFEHKTKYTRIVKQQYRITLDPITRNPYEKYYYTVTSTTNNLQEIKVYDGTTGIILDHNDIKFETEESIEYCLVGKSKGDPDAISLNIPFLVEWLKERVYEYTDLYLYNDITEDVHNNWNIFYNEVTNSVIIPLAYSSMDLGEYEDMHKDHSVSFVFIED